MRSTSHRKALPFGSVAVFMVIGGFSDAAQAGNAIYTVQELPGIGGPVTQAYDISDGGIVAGRGLNTSWVSRAVRWENGVVAILPGSNTDARGVSAAGDVAGGSGGVGTLWSDSGATMLSPLRGHTGAAAWDASQDGTVVGLSVNQVGDPVAVAWIGESPIALTVSHSYAFAINEANQIVGRRDVAEGRQALLWEGAANMVILPDFGNDYASATNISDNGVITGGACKPVAPGVCQPLPVVWEGIDHEIHELQRPPDGFFHTPWDANNRGVIVGYHELDFSGENTRALFWLNSTSEPVDLDTMIPADSGWTLRSAQAINHQGQIVGYGYRVNMSGQRAFLLTPINPSDMTADAVVDIDDLFLLLDQWGACPPAMGCPGDLDNDGDVTIDDLFQLLSDWT